MSGTELAAYKAVGTLYNARWIAEQIVEDDDGLLAELLKREEVEA